MLNQAELNFYGYNSKNIIRREKRGKILVDVRYDGYNNCYVVTRRTPKSIWRDRFFHNKEGSEQKAYNKAIKRFYEFLYSKNIQLKKYLEG